MQTVEITDDPGCAVPEPASGGVELPQTPRGVAMAQHARASRAVIVGMGNIGSFTAAAVARILQVTFVLLVDPDAYEEKNLQGQGITHADVGKRKVDVLRQLLLRINPRLQVEVFADVVQKLPLGLLRSSVVLGCLDSREARRDLSEACWRVGVPYIDAGVHADALLARVNTYIPRAGSPCFVCGWSQDDYNTLRQKHPCDGEDAVAEVPTNAWAILGQLAASFQVLEYQKLLAGGPGDLLDGSELLVDAAYYNQTVSKIRRSPHCRFDHEVWSIVQLDRGPRGLTLAQAFALAANATQDRPGPATEQEAEEHRGSSNVAMRVPGRVFAQDVMCSKCGHSEPAQRWVMRPPFSDRSHEDCSMEPEAQLVPCSFGATEQLAASRVPSRVLACSLHDLGLEAHDVFALDIGGGPGTSPSELFFALGTDQQPRGEASGEGPDRQT